MRSFKVFLALIRVNLQIMLAYRVDVAIFALLDLLWLGWDLLALGIIFNNTTALNGWGPGDLTALLGVFRLVNILMVGVLMPSAGPFCESIRDGSFDYTLLRPVNCLFMVSLAHVEFWELRNLPVAIALIAVGLSMSGGTVGALTLLTFVLLFASGALAIYSLWIVLIALTFWFVKADNNVSLLRAVWEAGHYPATIYPSWLRMIVTFVMPVALAVTVPLQALRGELTVAQVALLLAIGMGSFIAARWVWQAGIRRYAGASS